MISNERLEMISKYDTFVSLGESEEMAKELLALRKAQECNHDWRELHSGRVQAIYGCKLCHKYKIGQGSY